jgi:multidrug efflux pump subunit AcrB
LAWIGATWGHGVENAPVSLFSAWGMIALSGVIINDAVVFLAKYNSLVLEGKRVVDAVYQTGQARFRAIVLTTITTTVGLYPIILEKSFQAQFLKPMAIALAYGVLIGTGFILTFFPVAILVTNDMKRVVKYIMNRKKLWVLMGEKENKPGQKEIDELKTFPTRESVENVIVLQKNSID